MQAVAALKRWLFRLHGPEPAPIVLTQRRVFVLPTPAGLLYAVSLAVMLLGSINYNLSLGYALVFLLAGLGVVALLHTFRNLAQLEISPGRTEPVFAGENAYFGLSLRNRRGEGRYALALGLDGGATVGTDVPDGSGAVRLPLAARRRGWLHPGRVTLETRYPLGLVRAWSYVEPDMRCLVYPAPEADAPPLPPAGAGEAGGLRSGKGAEDFSGLRGHQPTDSPRHVAWKAVMRQGDVGPLLTKQFTGQAAAQLWLDWDMLPAQLGVEARLSRLARWLIEAQAAGLACGLRMPGQELPPAEGELHFQACLETLALYGEEKDPASA
ncbi:MAG: DUF58 domain-containing protein [Rhodocyclales bacterium]|nr:DUF58 domain-containing protein [Rhodocyclales bacterium]